MKARVAVDAGNLEVAKFGRTMRELINAKETRGRSGGINGVSMPKERLIISGGTLYTAINMSSTSNARFTLSKISI